MNKHATVTRDGYEVPLIGVPPEATLEQCDCCGDIIGLSQAILTTTQILCAKCARPPTHENQPHAPRP